MSTNTTNNKTDSKEVLHRGHLIIYKCGYYWTLGKPFTTIKKAKREIDKIEA